MRNMRNVGATRIRWASQARAQLCRSVGPRWLIGQGLVACVDAQSLGGLLQMGLWPSDYDEPADLWLLPEGASLWTAGINGEAVEVRAHAKCGWIPVLPEGLDLAGDPLAGSAQLTTRRAADTHAHLRSRRLNPRA